MTETSAVDLFTKKHTQLLILAGFANAAAWIVFLIQMIKSILLILGFFSTYYFQLGPVNRTILAAIQANTFTFVQVLINALNTLILGVAIALILKGVSVGLKMIVETNINVIENARGAVHE